MGFIQTGTAVTTWAATGTELGFAPATGFTGNNIDVHAVNGGASVFSVDYLGNAIAATYKLPSARKGTFVCTAAGTITISNTNEAATSDVIISMNTAGGTITTPPAMKTVTAGTGFTVLCGATDTSTYNYSILN